MRDAGICTEAVDEWRGKLLRNLARLTVAEAILPAVTGAARIASAPPVLRYDRSSAREATWTMPAMAIAAVRIHWRTPATVGQARLIVEVWDEDGALLCAEAIVLATAQNPPNQQHTARAALSYTPSAGQREMLIRVQRTPGHAGDTLEADLDVLGVQV